MELIDHIKRIIIANDFVTDYQFKNFAANMLREWIVREHKFYPPTLRVLTETLKKTEQGAYNK